MLLPDTLSSLPLVAAVLINNESRRRSKHPQNVPRGALIGVSAWFRADSVLLPLFLCATLLVLLPQGQWRRNALALIGAITIRNVLVFRSFVPIALGTAQNLSAGMVTTTSSKDSVCPLLTMAPVRRKHSGQCDSPRNSPAKSCTDSDSNASALLPGLACTDPFRISIHFAGLLLLVHPCGTSDYWDRCNVHPASDVVNRTNRKFLVLFPSQRPRVSAKTL